MEITLKQMRYAQAVAEEEHFGRAADRCHVTQSALSQQIKLLETHCDTPLFERLGKSVRPTPFGHEFLNRARKILQDANALRAFSIGHDGQPVGPIRFGLIPTVAPYLLPDIYPKLQEHLPANDFIIREGHTDILLKNLEKGTLDLALIATDPPETAQLHVAPLFADPFVLATHVDSPLADPTHLDNVPNDEILLLNEGHCFRDQALEACALRTDQTDAAFAATSLSTIVEFVANGQGVTLLPTISIKKETADPRICIKTLAAPGAGRMLSLAWRGSTPFSALYEDISLLIKSACAGHLSDPL